MRYVNQCLVFGIENAGDLYGFPNDRATFGENGFTFFGVVDVAHADWSRLPAGDGGVGRVLEPVAVLEPIDQPALEIGDMAGHTLYFGIRESLNDDVVAQPIDIDFTDLLGSRRKSYGKSGSSGNSRQVS